MKNKVTTKISSTLILFVFFLSFFQSTATATPALIEGLDNRFDQPIETAFDYLSSEQNQDAGFRWFDESSNVPTTIRVALAAVAAGYSQEIFSMDGNLPIDFISAAGTDWVFQVDSDEPGFNVARAGQILTAVAAANQNPHDFGPESIDLVYLIQSDYIQDSGTFGTANQENVTDQVWAILGLAAAHASIPEDSITWLINAQNTDGSWDDGFGSFLDTTPLGVLALAAADQETLNTTALQTAVDFILTNQQPDGGWQTEWDTSTNANTTGMMIQALVAVSSTDAERYAAEIESARLALLDIQQENGMIGGDFGNAYSTAEAVLGLTDQPIYNLGTLRRVSQAFDFIFNAQADDGGWGSVGLTLDVILALTSAGWDSITIQQNGNSPIDFIAGNIDEYIEGGPDAIGKLIFGLVAAGQNPRDFSDSDLVEALLGTYDPDSRAFGDPDNTWHQSLALLGLCAANQDVPEGAQQTLIELQAEDGGWEYLPGFGTSADNASLALQALLASGKSIDDEVIQSGLDFIQSQQTLDGGWGDSSTTAFAIMALNSLGIPASDLTTENMKSPIDNLFTYQNISGGFYFSSDFPEPNTISTVPAVLAALSGSYLISPTTVDEDNFAGLIIDAGDDTVEALCVRFTSPTISGFELLDKSEVSYEMQDGFINNIMNFANPSGGTMYWSYWRWDGREWQFNNMGAADSVIYPGSIEAWMFTSWEIFPSLPPDTIPNLDQTCQQRVLRNFADQPYLNFNVFETSTIDVVEVPVEIEPDVQDDPPVEDVEPVETIIEEPTDEEIAEETVEPTPAETVQETEEEARSIVPLIIIAVAGVLVFIILILVLKKRK